MKPHPLDYYLNTFKKIFEDTESRYEAHLRSHVFLYRMAKEEDVIFEILRRNMIKPGFFNQASVTPDFMMNLIDTPECVLSASFFGPLPDKSTDYTYSTMHHHDEFLLSTINAKGPGYTSLIFKEGFQVEQNTGRVSIELEKYCHHSPMNIEFIDKRSAHTLFYPADVTLTYALWCHYKPITYVNKLRKHPLIKKNKELVKKALSLFKSDVKTLGVFQMSEDYFYPDNGIIRMLPAQILPKEANHFVENFFYKLQYVGFNDRKFLEQLPAQLNEQDRIKAEPWIKRFLNNEPFKTNYDGYDMLIPKRNVHINDYRKCFDF